MIGLGSDKNNYGFMWPIDCTKDTIKNRGSTVNIWRIKLSISSIFRSVKTSCLCKIPSAKKNIFLLQKFSVFSFSSYIFFFSEYFPPFPSPIFLLRSSSRYQNVKMSKFQCPHSISRTCLAQEFGLVFNIFTHKYLPRIAWQLGHLWVTSWKYSIANSIWIGILKSQFYSSRKDDLM